MAAKESVRDSDTNKASVLQVEGNALLDLLSAQLNSALSDLDSPQRELNKFFYRVISNIEKAREMLASSGADAVAAGEIDKMLSGMKSSAGMSVVEFQSFDRVEQRLRNVRDSLHLIADHVGAEEMRTDEYVDQSILEQVKSTYSLEHEHTLHAMMERGLNRSELLTNSSSGKAQKGGDDIELF